MNLYLNRNALIGTIIVSISWRLKGVSPLNMVAVTVRDRLHRRPHCLRRPSLTLASTLLTDDDSPPFQLEANFDASLLSAAAFPLKDADGIYEIESKDQHL